MTPESLQGTAPACLAPDTGGRLARALAANADPLRVAFEDSVCRVQWEEITTQIRAGPAEPCAKGGALTGTDAIEAETIARCNADQAVIEAAMPGPDTAGAGCGATPRLGLLAMVIVRIENTAFIEQMLERGPRTFEGRSEAFWNALYYLGQHAEIAPEVQERLLVEIEAAVVRGELDAYNYAALADRIAITRHRHQLYGTHTSCAGGRAFLQPPLDDRDAAQARRAEHGLEDLESFLEGRSARLCR